LRKGVDTQPLSCYNKDTKKEREEKIMLEVKVTTVEIPMAHSMKKVAEVAAANKIRIYTAWEQEQIEKGWAEIPRLAQFIAMKIQDISDDGGCRLELNIKDVTFKNRPTDPRIGFIFDGLFTKEMASHITEVFESAGYKGGAYTKQDTGNGDCYRNGVIQLSWR
jgi:hypothetical protein